VHGPGRGPATAPAPSPRRARSRTALAVAVAAPLVALAGIGVVDPDAHGPTLCPWRGLTGAWCPGCGLTRATGWLVRGDVAESWRFHPMAVVLASQVVVAAAVLAVVVSRRRAGRRGPSAVPARARPPSGSWRTAALLVLGLDAAAFVVVWVARLASGAIPVAA
jgi:hypothetical protein